MNRYDWHRWFAWYPVRLVYEINEAPGFSYVDTGTYAWLCWVECRVHGEVAPDGDLTDWWEYRRPYLLNDNPMAVDANGEWKGCGAIDVEAATERTLRADYTRHPHCTTVNHMGHE